MMLIINLKANCQIDQEDTSGRNYWHGNDDLPELHDGSRDMEVLEDNQASEIMLAIRVKITKDIGSVH